MATKKRITKGGIAYHVLNRANGKLRIFKKDLDFIAFENILAESIERFSMRLCGYCIMSNHWHLILWPAEDGVLSDFMHWLTSTHTKRWHASHGTSGIGHIYQGPYKSFPIQSNWRYLKALQYVEANPVKAGIVETASAWQWSSFWQRQFSGKPFTLSSGPVPVPRAWPQIVNSAMAQEETAQLTNCIKRGRPYGDEDWPERIAKELNLESSLKALGRPKKWKE